MVSVRISVGQCTANNKFKSDSQRLALSLQASLVFMAQWISLGVSVVHTLIWRYVYMKIKDLNVLGSGSLSL